MRRSFENGNQISFLAILVFLIGSIFSSNFALADGSNLEGVWRGTIGTVPIVVCLDETMPHGSYYYLSNRKLIDLVKNGDKSNELIESVESTNSVAPKITGFWADLRVDNKRLVGNWSSNDGAKKSPINLTRITNRTKLKNCSESTDFFQPLINQEQFRFGQPQEKYGHVYRTVSVLDHHIQSIELTGTQYATTINQNLRDYVRRDMAEYFHCFRGTKAISSKKFSAALTILPSLPGFLSVRLDRSKICNQQLANLNLRNEDSEFHQIYVTWSLAKGKQLNFQKWFNRDGYQEVSTNAFQISKELRSVLEYKWKSTHPCKDAPLECPPGRCFPIRIDQTEVVFNPSPGGYPYPACEDDLSVPTSELQRFLTSEAKQQIRIATSLVK